MSVDTVWEFRTTNTKFGLDAVKEIGYDAKKFGCSKAAIITDRGITKTGIPDNVVSYLEERGVKGEIWDGVEPEPSVESMKKGIEWTEDRGFDLYISVGGGSSIDTAKVINLISCYGGEILDYVAPPTGKGKPVPGPLKPHIAVPTTAGTGSETSPASVISLENLKVGISSERCRPDLAIIDPMLHVSMPPKITAASGMDALSHAIESYITRRFNRKPKPLTPLKRPVYGGGTSLTAILAEKAIELIGRYLRRAFCNGRDIEARSGMALASHLAGMSFTNAGLTAVHAMALAVGGRFHTSHGETAAALLPAVMEFLIPTSPEKFARVAGLMGEPTKDLSLHEAAKRAVDAVIGLMKDVSAPNGLHSFGIKEGDVRILAKDALKIRRLLEGNPRLTTQADLENLFKVSLKYW